MHRVKHTPRRTVETVTSSDASSATKDKMNVEQQVLLEEWKAISAALQAFGAKRFAQLTVFIAATGFLLNAVLADRANGLPWGIESALKVVGIVLAGLFGIMEYSAKEYWKAYARRACAIEEQLSGFQLITTVERGKGGRGRRYLLSATAATFAIYGIAALGWIVWLLFG